MISAMFLILFAYFAVIALVNNKINAGVLFIESLLGLIGYSLGALSLRLISGKGVKGSNKLLSNLSLMIWGTIFGVAGVIERPRQPAIVAA